MVISDTTYKFFGFQITLSETNIAPENGPS